MHRFLFEIHPRPGQEENFRRAWREGSEIIQTYPGAMGTKLFKKVGEPAVLFAMAEWHSKGARDAAIAQILQRPDAEEVMKGHEQFADIDVIGSFDLIEQVHPSQP